MCNILYREYNLSVTHLIQHLVHLYLNRYHDAAVVVFSLDWKMEILCTPWLRLLHHHTGLADYLGLFLQWLQYFRSFDFDLPALLNIEHQTCDHTCEILEVLGVSVPDSLKNMKEHCQSNLKIHYTMARKEAIVHDKNSHSQPFHYISQNVLL